VATKHVRGLEELVRDLRKLTPEVAQDMLLTSFEAGSVPLASKWKSDAPYETGAYRRSIQVVREAKRVVVGTDITDPPYPLFLEFGTRQMPPHPSLRPALDSSQDNIRRTIRFSIEKQLQRLWPGNK